MYEKALPVTGVLVKDANDALHWRLPPSYPVPPFTGSRASPTARLWDCRLLWRRRGLVPVQRVRPEEGAEEDESARVQFKQDKAGAAGLETSRAAGGARLFCGSLNARRCRALWTLVFLRFLVDVFCFLKLENHLENKKMWCSRRFFCHKKIQDIW